MNRLRHIRFLFAVMLLLLAAGLVSCGNRAQHEALLRAEALMESDPRAARAVLDSLAEAENLPSSILHQTSDIRHPPSYILHLPSKHDAADWAWLKVQTDYKCDVPLTTDSLARIATNYYGVPRHPDYHAAMAWYTLGCAYKDMGDDVNGTDAFLKAKCLFPDTLIRYYALTELNLGIHHLNRHMDSEAECDFQSAKQNLIRLDDSTAVAFLDLSLGRCFLHEGDYAPAREWLEYVISNPHANDFVLTASYFEIAKVEAYYTHDYVKANEYLDYNIRHTKDKSLLSGVYGLKAVVFQEQGKLDSTWYYYHRSLNCRSDLASFAYNYRKMASLAPLVGKTDSVAEYNRLYHIYLDSLYIISNQQAIRQVMNDHRVEIEQQRMENEHRRLLIVVVAVVIILCFVLLALYLYHRNRNNRKTIALQEAIRQSNVVLMNLTIPEDDGKGSTPISAETLTNPEFYIRLFNMGKQLLDPNVMKQLKRLRVISGGEEADHIRNSYYNAIDKSFVELMMVLKLIVPSVNKRELQYIVSRMLGLEDKMIRTIQKVEDSTFRTQKMRLRKKFPPELIDKLILLAAS